MSAAASTVSQQPPATDAYGPDGRSDWLDVDWSEHRRWVTIDGRRANVVQVGSGPALLFVHGLSGSWPNWLENICAFATDHRVIAVDLPGFGDSEMPTDKISIPGYARWIDALCDELGVQSAAVVGNSMGGFVGAELAIQFPRRVERLCLISAAGISAHELRDDRGLALLRHAERILAFYTGWVASRSDLLARRPRMRRALMGFVAAHPERLPAPLIAEQVRGSGKPGFVDALDALTDYDFRDRLQDIGCPTLIVWGDRDRLVPVRDAAVFERLIPAARKLIYEDTGHVAMLERPARFNADLREFLNEGPPARAG